MKFEKNTKYNTFALFALIVVAFTGILVSLAIHASDVRAFFLRMLSMFSPIIYAGILMLILLPMVDFFELKLRKIMKKRKHPEKVAGILSILIVYILAASVVILAVVIIIPQFSVLYDFLRTSTDYLTALDDISNSLSGSSELLGTHFSGWIGQLKEYIVTSLTGLSALVPNIVSAFGSIISQTSNWVIGAIISVYALASRRRLKAVAVKINSALFPQSASARIAQVTRLLYNNTVWFLSSRAYNSIILGVVFYFALMIMGIKFHPVICLIVAICNFVPVFGMLIGGAASTLIVLVTDTHMAIWFVIVYVAVTVCGYLFVRPHITNEKVCLSLGTTMICILAGFFVANILGAIFAVPVFVSLRILFYEWEGKRKQKKADSTPE